MNLLELRLKTHNLPALRAFYGEQLEWPILAADETSLTLSAGATKLVFEQDDSDTFIYHFAFNIPQNQFAEAKAWLAARTPLTLVSDSGDDEIQWTAWNAHAVYFTDPAGNIGELIARHNLPNASDHPFSADSVLEVSEIGLAVPDVTAACDALKQELGIEIWDAGDGENFRAMGGEHGIFIVVKTGRAWFPTTDAPAALIPTTVTIRGSAEKTYTLPDTPYLMRVQQG